MDTSGRHSWKQTQQLPARIGIQILTKSQPTENIGDIPSIKVEVKQNSWLNCPVWRISDVFSAICHLFMQIWLHASSSSANLIKSGAYTTILTIFACRTAKRCRTTSSHRLLPLVYLDSSSGNLHCIFYLWLPMRVVVREIYRALGCLEITFGVCRKAHHPVRKLLIIQTPETQMHRCRSQDLPHWMGKMNYLSVHTRRVACYSKH